MSNVQDAEPAPALHVPTTTIDESSRLTITPVSAHDRSSSVVTLSSNSDFLSVQPPQSPTVSLGGETLRSRSFSSSVRPIQTEDALKPDPGTEGDFQVENNPFAFSPGQLNKLLNPKSLAAFKALGGIRGIAKGLRSDVQSGLSLDETGFEDTVSFDSAVSLSEKVAEPTLVTGLQTKTTPSVDGRYTDRTRVYSNNRLPEKKQVSIWQLIWTAFQDRILILLSCAAVLSLGLGLYETFGKKKEQEDSGELQGADWIEGVAIIVAILIVVLVGALNDYQKEKQFVKLNRKKESREVKVIRSGKSLEISIYDILVGDLVHLEPGDIIPADGIFVHGHGVTCDESSATGESDQMKKTSGEEVWKQIEAGTASSKLDPFIISGGKVLEGVGSYMVTSVGVNSSYGKIMMAIRHEAEATPLQVKLNGLANAIAKYGGGAAVLLFFVLLIRFLAGLPNNHHSAAHKASTFTDILIVSVTIIVVAVPEGLPLAVTLALAFATTRMLKENNLVRVLKSCEVMGSATVICSDKTGTLTQNKMTVVAGIIGQDCQFTSSTTAPEGEAKPTIEAMSSLTKASRDLLIQSIVVNSTAFEGEENGIQTFIGSKTETALLSFARDYLGMQPVSQERANAQIVQLYPFDSGRKCMAVVVKLESGIYRMYVKGASEILLAQAKHILTNQTSSNGDLTVAALTKSQILELEHLITTYAQKSLRTIGLLYKDFEAWPPTEATASKDDTTQPDFSSIFNSMVFVGLVGIQDPLREGVTEAVAQCKMAGVSVKMVTGDNAVTAQAIATECGIYTEGGIIMEGPAFRQLSPDEMDRILPRLQVLARSSPEDKRILVKRLKHLGETVAVTGDGTNDSPALKMADVGFSMGITGTEVAKEASAIILMDDNFSTIIKAIMWGRAVNDACRKFLQFQLTVNITAVILAFVSAVVSPEMESVLTAVQLLWVNLIMDTFAALALATDPPTPEILKRKPIPKNESLISLNMWKMIIGQAVYQLIVTLILHFAGAKIFGYTTKHEKLELDTMVFNTFVWMQIFNEFNNRRLDNKLNIFEGISRNYFFIGITFLMFAGQILIIFVGGAAFSVVHLNGVQWIVCLVLGALSLPWAVILRLIPDTFVSSCWIAILPCFVPIGKAWMSIKGILPSLRTKKSTDIEANLEKDLHPAPALDAPEITVTDGHH